MKNTNTESLIRSYNKWKGHDILERLVLVSLFFMPILSLSIRHWLSGWFSFLSLLAVISLSRNLRNPLGREEKALLWVFSAFLFSFILSATLNDWTSSSIRRIGTEFKYLLFIPLYILIRRYTDSEKYFFSGVIAGGLVLGLQALYEVLVLGNTRGVGIYGAIVFGDLSILFAFFGILFLAYKRPSGKIRIFCLLSIALALTATYLSGDRNGWLAGIILGLMAPFLLPSRINLKKLVTTYAFLSVLLALLFFVIDNPISKRAELAIDQTTHYFENMGAPDFKDYNLRGDSAGFRLEQWRVGLIAFRDAPWIGYGPGNAARTENEYVKRGIGHPHLYNPKAYTNIGGLHSTYFETLVNQGILGVLALFFFLGYPLYVFYRNRHRSPFISTSGIILILSYMIFGLTENPFVHDNFSSFYLTALAVLFTAAVRQTQKNDSHNMPTA